MHDVHTGRSRGPETAAPPTIRIGAPSGAPAAFVPVGPADGFAPAHGTLNTLALTLERDGEPRTYSFTLDQALGLLAQLTDGVARIRASMAADRAGELGDPGAAGNGAGAGGGPGGGGLARERVQLRRSIPSRGLHAGALGEVLSHQPLAKTAVVWFPRCGTLTVRADLLESAPAPEG